MNNMAPDVLAKAERSYRMNQKQWTMLGYSDAIALAVLAEFFAMERVRNSSQKPLNVLSMVGKSRVKAIADAVKDSRDTRQEPGGGADD